MANLSDVMQMCRLCLVKDQVNLPIFGGEGDIQQIFLKITACLPVKVSREDNLPKNICDGCSYKLDMLYQFWNTSSNSEKQLIDWLTAAGVDPKHKTLEPLGLAQPNVILKQEPVTDLDSMSSDTQNYIMQQQVLAYKPEEYDTFHKEAQVSTNSTKKRTEENYDSDEVTPAKRPRRITRNTKSIKDDDSDEDYDETMDGGMPKTEDDTDDDDDDDDDEGDDEGGAPDPDFVAVEEDADQPGPSGVNKSSSGPSSPKDVFDDFYKKHYGLIDCIVFMGAKEELDTRHFRFMQAQCYTNTNENNDCQMPRKKYKCVECDERFRHRNLLMKHVEEKHGGDDLSDESDEVYSSTESYRPDDDEVEECDDKYEEYDDKYDECHDKYDGIEEENTEVGVEDEDDIENVENSDSGEEDIDNDISVIGATAKVQEEDSSNIDVNLQTKFVCFKCFDKFDSKIVVREHLLSRHDYHSCESCSQVFSTLSDVLIHFSKVHKGLKGKWRCIQCKTSFAHQDDLIEHNLEKHNLLCRSCNNLFTSVFKLTYHKSKAHGLPLNILCDYCGCTTMSPVDLKYHKMIHFAKPYNCELCSKTVYGEGNYVNHVLREHLASEGKMICGTCNKEFATARELINHEETCEKLSEEESDVSSDSFTESSFLPEPEQSQSPYPREPSRSATPLREPRIAFHGGRSNTRVIEDKTNDESIPIPTISITSEPAAGNSRNISIETTIEVPSTNTESIILDTRNTTGKGTDPNIGKSSEEAQYLMIGDKRVLIMPGFKIQSTPTMKPSTIKQTICVPNNANTNSGINITNNTICTTNIIKLPLEQYRHIIPTMKPCTITNATKSSNVDDFVISKENIVEEEVDRNTENRPKIFLKPISSLVDNNTPPPLRMLSPKTENRILTDVDSHASSNILERIIERKLGNIQVLELPPDKPADINLNCAECDSIFNNLKDLARHRTNHKCKVCEYNTCIVKSLDSHYRLMHNYQNQCVICDIHFSSIEVLQAHNNEMHSCPKCKKLFTSLRKHTSDHKCLICAEYYCTSKDLVVHYVSAHNINHVCAPCNAIFHSTVAFLSHKNKFHYCMKCQSFRVEMKLHAKCCTGKQTKAVGSS